MPRPMLGAALVLVMAACGDDDTVGGGFENAEECLEGTPNVDPEITPGDLADQCESTLADAEDALAAVGLTLPPPSALSTLATATTSSPTSSPRPTRSSPEPPVTSPTALMPNVVCMNLQDAQDAIQDAGVFISRSRDATGAERSQLIDSNWEVVAQTPLPETPIGELEAVLDVVKIGEPSPC